MAKSLQVKELRINNVVVLMDGENISVTLGRGDANQTAYVGGGGDVEVVSGRDTSSQIGCMKFDIPVIDGVVEQLNDWHDKIGENFLHLRTTNDEVLKLSGASLATDSEISFASDGKVSLEFKGNRII